MSCPWCDGGDLCTRLQVTAGYEGMPVETTAATHPDGYLHTGDLGVMDARGYFSIVGRSKDMIIWGGENTPSARLRRSPVRAPVGGRGCRHLEHRTIGWARPWWRCCDRRGVDPSVVELHACYRETLAPFQTPSQWFAVEQFPATASGKIKKFELAELVEAGQLRRLV